jgi:hypothetical protein
LIEFTEREMFGLIFRMKGPFALRITEFGTFVLQFDDGSEIWPPTRLSDVGTILRYALGQIRFKRGEIGVE